MSESGKAVSIPVLSNYNSYGETVSNFSREISGSLSNIKVDFVNKTEGSSGEAIEAYLTQLESFESAIYEQLPSEIETVGSHFKNYGDDLMGLGFDAGGKVQTDDADVTAYFGKMTNEDGEQRTVIKEKIKGLQQLLNEVNAKTGKDFGTSDIQSAIDSALTEHQSSTQSLHNNVLSAQEAFISNLNTSTEALQGLNGIMDRVATISAEGSGLRPSDIKDIIVNQTATPSEIAAALGAAETAEDAAALNAYLKKDFVTFFDRDPNTLSDGVYVVVVGGMNEIFSGDNTVLKELVAKNFEEGVNSLITRENTTYYSDLPTGHPALKDTSGYNGYTSGTKNLQDFYTSRLNEFMLKLSAAGTAYIMHHGNQAEDFYKTGKITLEQYNDYVRNIESANSLVALFDNIYLLKLEEGESISNIKTHEDGGFRFNENYKHVRYSGHTPVNEIRTRQIHTNHIAADELLGEYGAIEIKSLDAAKTKAVIETVANLAITFAPGGLMTKMVSYALPVFLNGSPISSAAKMSKDYYDSSLYTGNYGAEIGKFSSASLELINKIVDIYKKQDNLSKKNYADFFGQTGTKTTVDGKETITINSFSYPATKRIEEFEKNGAKTFIEEAGYTKNKDKEYVKGNKNLQSEIENDKRYDEKVYNYFINGATDDFNLKDIRWDKFNAMRELLAEQGISIGYE